MDRHSTATIIIVLIPPFSGLLQQHFQLYKHIVTGTKMCTWRCTEYIIMIFPSITSRPPHFPLVYVMLFERFNRKMRQSYTLPAASRLRLRLNIQITPLPPHLSRQPAESAPNVKHAGSKVNVLPLSC